MKTLIAALVMMTAQIAAADESTTATIELNWTQKPLWEEVMTWQCDDSYFNRLNLILPGVLNQDVIVRTEYNDGCKVKDVRNVNIKGKTRTLIRLDGPCNATFSVEPVNTPRTKILVELADAC